MQPLTPYPGFALQTITTADKLRVLHEDLCHPVVTRMLHFVRSKNMPYFVENVRAIVQACQVCSEMKPRFIRRTPQTLIKACPWCNGYRRRKWTRKHEFKSWTRLIAFHIALIPLGKV